MKLFFLLLVSLICGLAGSGQTNPFKRLGWDSIVMIDFLPVQESPILIDSVGKPLVVISKRVRLDRSTAFLFVDKIGDRRSFGGEVAGCFEPHLGFLYYREGKVVGQISVYLSCNRLWSKPELPVKSQAKREGLSKAFGLYLDKLIRKHAFSHGIIVGD
jgi:hypothetical protein